MSAGNRKNRYPVSTPVVDVQQRRRSVYLIALAISVAIIASLVLYGPKASADVNSELGPVATVYTVKGVTGSKATGFYVRYHNGVIRILPPMKNRLKDADDGAERYMVKHRYEKLAQLKRTLNKFGANDVFDSMR